MSQRVEILKRKFVRRAGLPFQEVLSEASIQSVLAAEEVNYRNRLYTPIITIWMFLSQVLEPDKSLSNAVKRGTDLASECWRRTAFERYGRLRQSPTTIAGKGVRETVLSDGGGIRGAS